MSVASTQWNSRYIVHVYMHILYFCDLRLVTIHSHRCMTMDIVYYEMSQDFCSPVSKISCVLKTRNVHLHVSVFLGQKLIDDILRLINHGQNVSR